MWFNLLPRKLRPQIPNKDAENQQLVEDSKKCKHNIAESLDALTSALSDHPTGGDEDTYNTLKLVLDGGLSIKSSAEKIEAAATHAVDKQFDEDLAEAVDKAQEKDEKDKLNQSGPSDANKGPGDEGNKPVENGKGTADAA